MSRYLKTPYPRDEVKKQRLVQEANKWRTLQDEVAAGIARLEQSLGVKCMEPSDAKREIHSLEGVCASDVQELPPLKPSTAHRQVKLPRLEIMDRDMTPCKPFEKHSVRRLEEKVIEAPKPTKHQDVLRWFDIMSERENGEGGADLGPEKKRVRFLMDP